MSLKNYIESIPNRLKAIYLFWLFLHLVLLLLSGSYRFGEYGHFFDRDFFPFEGVRGNTELAFKIRNYDISEFLIYTLTPFFLYLFYYYWTKMGAVSRKKLNNEIEVDTSFSPINDEENNEIFSDLQEGIPIFIALGIRDKTSIIEADELYDSNLLNKFNRTIKLFQAKYNTEAILFKASGVTEDQKTKTLILGIEDGMYRCCDSEE